MVIIKAFLRTNGQTDGVNIIRWGERGWALKTIMSPYCQFFDLNFVEILPIAWQNYRLAFSTFGRDPSESRWKGAGATIQEAQGQNVWGCIWRLHNEHMETLDR